ncbi:MAG: AsmA family protein, partial [Roseibium sp.]|uniref:AsmA family protein n=1 Tax=Roseibium sp. TaxID=1936156 RepID=UPI00261C794B
LNQADLRSLSELVLGPDQWFSAGDGSSIWPTAAFGTPLLKDLDLTLDFRADSLLVDETTAIANPRAEVRLTPSLLRLDGLNGSFAGGRLDGSLSLRRSDAEAAVSGRVKLEKADLRQLAWRPSDRAVAAGTLDLFLEFEGAGRSISAIVTGLSGGGTFAMDKGDFRGLNPQAFPLVTRAVDAGLDLRDEKIREVFISHMAAGTLPFERVDGTLTLVGGRLSARNVVVDSEKAEIFGSAEVDLGTYDLDADFSLKIDPGEDAVTGAEPQVGLLFQGPVEAPRRRVDVGPFTAYLTLRAFEQEVERVEKLQAEILERDRLVRELKQQREAKGRRERAAQAAALAAEEERLRLEESQSQEGQSAPTPQNESTPAQETNAAPPLQQSEARQQSGAVQPFAERIRAVLGSPDPETTQSVPDSAPQAKPSNALPPLDPPVSIEDLITREVGGGPLILPGAPQ